MYMYRQTVHFRALARTPHWSQNLGIAKRAIVPGIKWLERIPNHKELVKQHLFNSSYK